MAENPASKQRRRGSGRPFEPGQSGNPAGKPRGTRHRITLLAEKLMADDAENVVRAVIEAAKGGDMTAARLILDRIAPAPRGRRVRFVLPPIDTSADLTAALGAVLGAVSAGELTPDEGQAVAGLIEAKRRVFEIIELEARVAVLEKGAKP